MLFVLAFHGTNGPLVITETYTSPLDAIHKMAAIEKGLNVVDCNGASQIGRHGIRICITVMRFTDGMRTQLIPLGFRCIFE